MPRPTLIIAGPTASGKSRLAMELARQTHGEIINCDSVQFYRGFNIGSAKPSEEEQREIPHHLLDLVNADEVFDAHQFGEQAIAVIQNIRERDKYPIVVGGTGLYIRALLQDQFQNELPNDPKLRAKLNQRDAGELFAELRKLDHARASELHPNDKFRVARALEIITLSGKPVSELYKTDDVSENEHPDYFYVVLMPDRPTLHARIAERTRFMLDSGLVDEVKSLLNSGCSPESKPMQSIGYKQVVDFLSNPEATDHSLHDLILFATRQYAKRQCTWFKKAPFNLLLEGTNLEHNSKTVRKAMEGLNNAL